jgi:ribonuclease P protein component
MWSSGEQAYVPAQQPPSCEDAWLPAAHAYSCRSGHLGRQAPEGPLAHQRVTAGAAAGGEMLPAATRMRRSADFAAATRRGSRAGRPLMSGHLLVEPASGRPALVGFVVSKAVGSAVVRNRVKRRLRHLARGHLQALPGGSLLVVRASPRAATAAQEDLAADLDLVIASLLRRQRGVAST